MLAAARTETKSPPRVVVSTARSGARGARQTPRPSGAEVRSFPVGSRHEGARPSYAPPLRGTTSTRRSPLARPSLAPRSPLARPSLAPRSPLARPSLAPRSPLARPSLAPRSRTARSQARSPDDRELPHGGQPGMVGGSTMACSWANRSVARGERAPGAGLRRRLLRRLPGRIERGLLEERQRRTSDKRADRGP